MVYEAGGFDASQLKDPRARAVVDETMRKLSTAINEAVPHDVPQTLRIALEENAFIFSGFKTFHSLREVGLSMLDDKGDVKPLEAFQKDVQAINAKYNTNYLRAEYQHALGSSLMAVKWQQLTQNTDRYFLQYRTAEDEKVRESHALLNGITLPAGDPFWDKYYPPNGWGCRCQAVQVRRSKYPQSDAAQAMKQGDAATEEAKQKMFRFNTGKTMRLFSKQHPYFKAPQKAKEVVEELTKEQRLEQLRKQLPDNLTDAEKDAKAANNYEIEQALKIKCGKPMTVEEADKQSANPKHVLKFLPDEKGTYIDKAGNRFKLNPDYNRKRDEPFSINCQTCAPAYALRLMGFDVTAKGNTSGSLSEYLSKQRSFEAWTNADGSPAVPTLYCDWLNKKGYKQMTEKRYREFFDECCKDEGVYIITIGWKGGGGHATVLQRFNDGTLAYIEPQEYDEDKGAKRNIAGVCQKGETRPYYKRGVLRVDNKLFNMKFASIFNK